MKYALFTLIVFCSVIAFSQNVAQWRGANRDGIYTETGLLKTWPTEGPKLLWDFSGIGNGYSSFAVTTDKVFVNGEIDSVSHLFAFNTKGALLWKSPNGPDYIGEGFSSSFPGSRSTPTVVGDLVYVCSGLGRIACFEVNSGIEKWSVNMQSDLKGQMNYFGYAESLLVEGNKLFCYPGGPEASIVALDRFTGKKLWSTIAPTDTVVYCSPMIIDLPERKLLVTFSGRNLLGLDAETGEILWRHAQTIKQYNQHSNTPIYRDGFIYYVTSHGNGVVKLALSADGKNISEVWRKEIPENSFNGFLLLDKKLYCSTHKIKMSQIDINSGAITDSLQIKTGTIVSADGMLYYYSDNGEISLIDVADQKMKVVSKFKIDKGTKEALANLVISNGIMYVRKGNYMGAYSISN